MDVRSVLPRDAIPSIDDPTFDREYAGAPGDEVLVVEGDPARAYPVRILSYHEVVNDEVDGRPVAVTWCPICWSAVVYDRTVGDRTLSFGVSGKLADDALVLYDRETGTEWQQTTGEAIDGPLAGHRLSALPGPTVTYGRFVEEYPEGVVLRPEKRRDGRPSIDPYDVAPYRDYADREAFGLHGMRGEGPPRSWDRTDLGPKTLVLGIERGEEAVGYPLPRVEAGGGAVTDAVGDLNVVVFAAEGRLHAFEDPGLDFAGGDGVVHAGGTTWDPVSGESADGRRLDRVTARTLFAFAWQDAHGPDAFYDSGSRQ